MMEIKLQMFKFCAACSGVSILEECVDIRFVSKKWFRGPTCE